MELIELIGLITVPSAGGDGAQFTLDQHARSAAWPRCAVDAAEGGVCIRANAGGSAEAGLMAGCCCDGGVQRQRACKVGGTMLLVVPWPTPAAHGDDLPRALLSKGMVVR